MRHVSINKSNIPRLNISKSRREQILTLLLSCDRFKWNRNDKISPSISEQS